MLHLAGHSDLSYWADGYDWNSKSGIMGAGTDSGNTRRWPLLHLPLVTLKI